MSLDLSLVGPETTLECICQNCDNRHQRKTREHFWDTNITHNVASMFRAAPPAVVDIHGETQGSAYNVLWHGDGLRAGDQIDLLAQARRFMEANPFYFKQLQASNSWGTYEQALSWLDEVIEAFKKYPNAVLECDR